VPDSASFTGLAHLAIVVRDMATSVGWYGRVLGFERVGEVRPGPVEAGHPRQLMRHPGSGMVIAVHEPVVRSHDRFDPSRTGLDHVSLALADAAQLDAWARRLDDLDVPHSPVHDLGHARMLTFADPDGIAWELWSPAAG
jgi:glyoxylase I family protein